MATNKGQSEEKVTLDSQVDLQDEQGTPEPEIKVEQTDQAATAQATADEIIAAAKAEAEKIKADAEAAAKKQAAKILADAEEEKQKALIVEETAAPPPDVDWLEEKVEVTLFKDNDQYKNDVFVSVNGETCSIQRGVPVLIKRKFALVLANSDRQDLYAAQIAEQFANDYREAQKKNS